MMFDPKRCIVFNDMVRRGKFGEKVLWSYLHEDLGIPMEDWTTLRANSWYEAKLNFAARNKDQRLIGIQNATWAHPNTCGAKRTIVVLQDNIIRQWNDPIPQRATIDAADIVVANGTLIASDYASICGAKTRVIPIGIDDYFWTPGPQRAQSERKRVIFVGDTGEHKGYSVIASLARKRRDLDWTFILKQPSGHDASLGETLVAVSPEEVRAALRRSDVFILGSPVESQCLAALEAMACGLPVVMRPTGVFHDWRPDRYFEVLGPARSDFELRLDEALQEEIAYRFDYENPFEDRDFSITTMLGEWLRLLREMSGGL